MDVVDFNIAPNQRWFVRLSPIGGAITVELFNSQDDAAAGENRVGVGLGAFGTVPVTLTPDTTAPLGGEALAKFNSSLPYHLVVTGAAADGTKIFAIGPFTDLPSIEDPLMLTEAMIQARGELEINRGTHSRFYSDLTLARHYPELDEGMIVTLSSTKRGIIAARQKVLSMTTEIRIDEGGEVSFADTIETVEYLDFVRQ